MTHIPGANLVLIGFEYQTLKEEKQYRCIQYSKHRQQLPQNAVVVQMQQQRQWDTLNGNKMRGEGEDDDEGNKKKKSYLMCFGLQFLQTRFYLVLHLTIHDRLVDLLRFANIYGDIISNHVACMRWCMLLLFFLFGLAWFLQSVLTRHVPPLFTILFPYLIVLRHQFTLTTRRWSSKSR